MTVWGRETGTPVSGLTNNVEVSDSVRQEGSERRDCRGGKVFMRTSR